jgi:hypothetical protein
VADVIVLEFYLKPYFVVAINEYQPAALANPEREPGKVKVP